MLIHTEERKKTTGRLGLYLQLHIWNGGNTAYGDAETSHSASCVVKLACSNYIAIQIVI